MTTQRNRLMTPTLRHKLIGEFILVAWRSRKVLGQDMTAALDGIAKGAASVA
jgi:hypothetical protein